MIFGREEIRRYELNWAGQWVNYNPDLINKKAGEYASLGHEYYFTSPKILVRRTGNYVLAVPDFKGYFVSNNQFVLLKKSQPLEPKKEKEKPPSLFYLAGILNSNFMTWYFRSVQPVVGNLFPELKINHIHDFPLPSLDFGKARDKSDHDQMVALVKRMMELLPQPRKVVSEHDKRTLESPIQATEYAINQLVYKLYQLADEEIEMIEKEILNNPPPKKLSKRHVHPLPKLEF